MKKIRGSVDNQRGVTLIEVLVCIIVIAMIIGPLTFSFTTAVTTKAEARNIMEATNYAETLMKAVKSRLSEDMAIKQKKESHLALSPEEQSRYDRYISTYMPENGLFTAPMDQTIWDYLELPTMAENEQNYDTQDFAYQVVMWPLSQLITAGGGGPVGSPLDYQLTVEESSINNSGIIKLRSEDTYTFNPEFYNLITEPITFSAHIDGEFAAAFSGQSDGTRLDNKVTLPGGGAGSAYVRVDLSDPTLQSNADYIVHVEGSDELTYGIVVPISDTNISVVNLDITGILRDVNLSDQYTFKIINQTGHNLTVRVIRSYEATDDVAAINNRFHWVGIDEGTGKTNFEFADYQKAEENYLVALFVREKNPSLGKKGKIVKKMVDVFSYDIAYSERR